MDVCDGWYVMRIASAHGIAIAGRRIACAGKALDRALARNRYSHGLSSRETP
jgi:hypothetical protein